MLVLAYSWWVDHYVYAIADNNIVWIFREIKFSRKISLFNCVVVFFLSWKQQLTCPCIFMMTTVFVRLQTTILSGFFGSRCTEFTLTLPPADAPIDLKVLIHSVVFTFQTLTVPSDEALINWCPSEMKGNKKNRELKNHIILHITA